MFLVDELYEAEKFFFSRAMMATEDRPVDKTIENSPLPAHRKRFETPQPDDVFCQNVP